MSTLREELETYGRLRFFAEGDGQFLTGEESYACTFAVAQRFDGDVFIACQAALAELHNRMDAVTKIRGSVEGGMTLETQGYLQWINFSFNFSEGQVVFRVRSVMLSTEAASQPTAWSYGLTNLLPNEPPSKFSVHGARLVPAADYQATAKKVRRQRNPEVTYYLEASGGVAPDEWIDDICSVLSIAHGTAVAWIERRSYDEKGELSTIFYASRVTRTWSALAIAELKDGQNLEKWLQHYQGQADKWGLRDGLVKTYIDAKVDWQYLEGRSVALIVCLEMLRESTVHAVGGTILPEDDFALLESKLQSGVHDLLLSFGLSPNEVDQLSSPGRLRALNRRSFRSLLRRAVQALGVEVSNETIARVVAYRNKLVHEGQFYCRVASDEERASVPACEDETEEYFFLMAFVDQLMLAMLDPTLKPLKFREPEG
jgi:hypothetical protein